LGKSKDAGYVLQYFSCSVDRASLDDRFDNASHYCRANVLYWEIANARKNVSLERTGRFLSVDAAPVLL
jgi:hypothetical protein